MKIYTKKIVYICIPHIFIEGERLRCNWENDARCIVTTGESPASLIIDASSNNPRHRNVGEGVPLKNINYLLKDFIIIPVDFDYMREINTMIIEYLRKYSIIIESSYFGKFYIDLTGTERLFGRVIDTCREIITHLNETYGFNSKIGIGANRLTSYLASKITSSNSVYEIFEKSEETFLDPISISYLPNLSWKLKNEILSSYNIQTLKDIKAFSKSDLIAMFNESGSLLYRYSRNKASNFLTQRKEEKIIRQELMLNDSVNDDHIIKRKFFQLILEICIRTRKENIFPLHFNLQVIYMDDYKFLKSGKLETPTFIEKRLYKELLPQLEKALQRRTCIKKISLTFSKFIPAVIQPSLFHGDDKDLRLCRAFDFVREKFGKGAIYFLE